MAMLDLINGTRTNVWYVIRDLAMNDEVMARTIQTFIVWDGSKISYSPDRTSMMPILRMHPVIGPMSWYSPGEFFGPLIINILMSIQTRDVSDAFNLWEAFENIYYPYGDRNRQQQIEQALKDAGAITGQVEFHAPAYDPDPRINEDGIFDMIGAMRLDVKRVINP